jgi:hypothetical protein
MELPPAPTVRVPALDRACEGSGTRHYSDIAYLREGETGGQTTGDSARQAQSANGLVCSNALFYSIDKF